MKNSLARNELASTRVEASQPLTTGEESEAIDAFDRAVVAMMQSQDMKAETVASELGVSYQNLSEFRRGSRTIAAHRLYRLVRKDIEAARVIIGSLCEAAGFAPPVRKRTVNKRDVQRQLSLELRRLAPVYELLRREAAAKLGTDEQTIDNIWDEPTDVDALPGAR